jgi:hypothetical protein
MIYENNKIKSGKRKRKKQERQKRRRNRIIIISKKDGAFSNWSDPPGDSPGLPAASVATVLDARKVKLTTGVITNSDRQIWNVATRGRIYYQNNLVTSGDLVISESFSKNAKLVVWCGIISDHVAKSWRRD